MTSRRPDLPGDAAWWLFIAAEMVTLAIFFIAFAVVQSKHPLEFAASREYLDANIAFANTLILITSGWLAAKKRLNLAALLGFAFVIIKTLEYIQKSNAGFTIGYDTFSFFYWFITGFHFLHVILGIGILLWAARRNDDKRLGESAASFWHMLDLAWVIIFPLLYLDA